MSDPSLGIWRPWGVSRQLACWVMVLGVVASGVSLPVAQRDGQVSGTMPLAPARGSETAPARPQAPSLPLPVIRWTEVNEPSAPPPREFGGLTYDVADGYVLLFGGGSQYYSSLNDTWALMGRHWVQLCTANAGDPGCGSPNVTSCQPFRSYAALAYDARDSYVLLVTCAGTTWSYSSGYWTQRAAGTTLPMSGYPYTLTYDPVDHYVVLFAGGQTWTYDGGNWTNRSTSQHPMDPVFGAQMFFDTTLSELILPGGQFSNQTWAYRAGNWTLLHPVRELPGFGGASSYDQQFGYGVLSDVFNTSGSSTKKTNDTWVFSNDTWSNITAHLLVSPDPRIGSMMAYDPLDGYSVLFGGETASYISDYNDTWILSDPIDFQLAASPPMIDLGETSILNVSVHGGIPPFTFNDSELPSYCQPVVAPGMVPCVPSTAGTDNISLALNDSIGEVASATTQFTVYPALTERASVGPNPTTVGHVTWFNATVTGGAPPVSAEWRLSDGTNSSSPVWSHAFASAGTYNATFVVRDGRGFNFTSSFQIVANPAPTISLSTNATVTDVGLPVSFTAIAFGGTAPLSYGWTFGDGASSDLPTVNHTYAAAGAYVINVTLADSLGVSVHNSTQLVVHGVFRINATASETRVVNGTPVAFDVVYTGGTAPFFIDWDFGDGASASSSPNPTHAYDLPGNYTASVTVRDSVGAVQTLHLYLHVVPPTSQPPPHENTTGSPVNWVPWALGGLALALMATAVVVAVVWRKRSRRGET